MPREFRPEGPPAIAQGARGEMPEGPAVEALESDQGAEISFQSGPVRGILNAVVIGAGAWMIILAAAALARAIFFG